MSAEKIAERYVKGLIEALKEGGPSSDLKTVHEQLQGICEALESNELKQVLYSPAVGNDVKTTVLDSMLKQVGADKSLESFLKILIKNGRFNSLPVIASTFEKQMKDLSGSASASLVSASSLEEKHVQEIKAFLESKFDTSIDLELLVDPEIMGGFVIKMGHRILDFSLKSKLEKVTNAALLES